MTIKHLEQLYQRQWRLGLASLISRERIDAAAENLGRFTLVEREFLAHSSDKTRIDNGCIDLLRESAHFAHDAIRLYSVQDRLGAGRAEIARHRSKDGL